MKGEIGMATHDRYENDILKQLTRIASAIERIEKANQMSMIKLKDDAENMKPSDISEEK